MEIPKTLWLKKHMDPARFSQCQFFDLPDFLTYKATGEITRSACSLTCKCSYVPDKGPNQPAGWQDSFFEKIGLEDFVKNNYAQLGPVKDGLQRDKKQTNTLTAGLPVGKGLSEKAAKELGLLPGTPVGSAVIDACVISPTYKDCSRTKTCQLCRVGGHHCRQTFPRLANCDSRDLKSSSRSLRGHIDLLHCPITRRRVCSRRLGAVQECGLPRLVDE